jgi:hypothetical protein
VEEDQITGLEQWRRSKNRTGTVEEDQIPGLEQWRKLELWRKINYQDWSSGGRSNNWIGAVEEDQITGLEWRKIK